MAHKAFSVSAPTIWKDLPLNCRATTCVNSFKLNLKSELFSSAYADHFNDSRHKLKKNLG